MDWIAIVIAAAAGYAFGAAWYGALGRVWRKALGAPEAEVAARMRTARPHVIAGVSALLTSAFLAHAFAASDIATWHGGLTAGLGAGLLVAAPWLATSYAFAGRPAALTLIDAGHVAGACAVIGLALGLL